MKYFFLLFPLLSFAGQEQVRIYLKEKNAIIENNSCFPVVISVNDQVISLPKNSSQLLEKDSWTKWHWMPGTLGKSDEKRVISPLKGMVKVDHGPGTGVHTESSFYGYDFSVPEGTSVYPMEAGVVIKTVNLYDSSHQDKKRRKENNIVEILHLDGTVGRYSHLKKDSLKVKLCDVVELNQVLALSGNTGYSSGPHLHVDIFRAISGAEFKTLPLKFNQRD